MAHPAPFDALVPRSFMRTAATPARPLDPAFCGIRIAAPASVSLWGPEDPGGRAACVPVAGLVTVPSGYPPGRELLESLTFLVSRNDGAVFIGSVETVPNRARPPEPLPMTSASGRTTTHYFNVDLADVVELPPQASTLFAYVFLGPHVSNVVRIEVVDDGSGA